MDQAEFEETTTAVVEALLPRIPQQYVDGFRSVIRAAEHWYALELLMDTLVDDRVVLSVEERDTIERLVRAGRSDNDLIPKLPGLVVRS